MFLSRGRRAGRPRGQPSEGLENAVADIQRAGAAVPVVLLVRVFSFNDREKLARDTAVYTVLLLLKADGRVDKMAGNARQTRRGGWRAREISAYQ